MSRSLTTKLSRTNERTRSTTAPICGLALAMVLSGNMMAYQPAHDLPDGSAAQAASPVDRGIESEGWIDAKLKTTAGYQVLVIE